MPFMSLFVHEQRKAKRERRVLRVPVGSRVSIKVLAEPKLIVVYCLNANIFKPVRRRRQGIAQLKNVCVG